VPNLAASQPVQVQHSVSTLIPANSAEIRPWRICPGPARKAVMAVGLTIQMCLPGIASVRGAVGTADSAAAISAAANAMRPPPQTPGAGPLYIAEYRIVGSQLLKQSEIGEAVYPFLGPGRSQDDVEQARAALEKVYKEKGYQTVSVQIPLQQGKGGIIFLQVIEAKVGRLRVHGSRYFSLAEIKRKAPSLAEGTVPNFNDITRDIVGLNQWPDRRVTPTLRAGIEPGTVDIDLTVKDSLPLHGSIEINNRYSPDTKPLRLNGSISYGNLWQRGHAAGLSFQVSPERTSDVKVLSAFYQARFQELDWLSLMVLGTKQDSNVSTLGGSAVAGRGQILGARALISLPAGKDFYQSVSLGIDYKHFDQSIFLGTGLDMIEAPITYYPLSANYSGTWFGKDSKDNQKTAWTTEFNFGLTFHVRGLGSGPQEFENSRFKADGSFAYLRGDLAHTHELPAGFQVFGKVQGQVSDQPLVSSEQFSAGGIGTARGYLEGEVPGDSAGFGSIELRSPPLLDWWGRKGSEWRIYAFADAGRLTIQNPLPDQQSTFDFASIGVGSRLQIFEHFNGSIDAGLPLIGQTRTQAHDLLLTFRVWADF